MFFLEVIWFASIGLSVVSLLENVYPAVSPQYVIMLSTGHRLQLYGSFAAHISFCMFVNPCIHT